MNRQQRGASLIEVIAVLVISAVVVALLASWLRSSERTSTRQAIVEQQAREMVQVAQAVRGYLKEAGGLPAPGTRIDVDLASLVDGVRLPFGFGERTGLSTTGGPRSPAGQHYRASAIQRPGGGKVFEVMVWTQSAPSGRYAATAGIRDTAEALEALATQVAGEIRRRYPSRLSAAVLPAGSPQVDPAAGFGYNVGAWLAGGTLPRTSAVALSGFVALSVASELPDPAQLDPSAVSECRVVENATTCPTGYNKLAGWQTCQGANTTEVRVEQIQTPIGTLTLTSGERRYTDGRTACGGTCPTTGAGATGAAGGGCGVAPLAGNPSACNAFSDQTVRTTLQNGVVLPYTAEGGVLNWSHGGIVALAGDVLQRVPRCAAVTTTYGSSRSSTATTYPFGGTATQNSLCCR